MKRVIQILTRIIAFLALTILTQIGGVVLLIVLFLKKQFHLKRNSTAILFLILYVVSSVFVVPPLARIGGRVPLPYLGKLSPVWLPTILLNRHYVRPSLKTQIGVIATKMAEKYPGTNTRYLDANFPFFDGFPLFPHLSHNDGKKLDLAFYYTDAVTNKQTALNPSYFGYGVFEEPNSHEYNQAASCESKGFWQYGVLGIVMPKRNTDNFLVDVPRTRTLIELLATDSNTAKIFLEPHLKKRWNLSDYTNIRFHGCQAVRHDDHIHFQGK